MARYDYRCRACGDVFEVSRPVDAPARDEVRCPSGHPDTARVWSAVAVGGRVGSSPAPAAVGAGGGCCGGGCCG